MVSKHYEDNFQPVSVEIWGIYHRKKRGLKIYRFLKNWFLWDETYISRIPTLRRIQIYTFYPSFLTWPDSIVQNVPLIDDNSITLKYCKFLRNVTTLFFVLSFIIFTSLCLLLFVYISCNDYYVLITLFPRLITLSHAHVIMYEYCYNGALYLTIIDYYVRPEWTWRG